MPPEGTWDELPCEWGEERVGVESGRSPRGGHGMSSHVSGGRRMGGYPGGTWDELPCEWGVEWEGGA